MASDLRYDLLYVGVDTTEKLAQLIEKAFGSGGVWTSGRNVRWYRADGYDFVVCMPTRSHGDLWVGVDAPTVEEQQRRANVTFERLAAADVGVSLRLVAEDDTVVRSRPASHAA